MDDRRVRQLRALIDEQLREHHVYDKLHAAVRQVVSQAREADEPTDPDSLFASLQERGLIEDLVRSLRAPDGQPAAASAEHPSPADPGRRYLHVKVMRGRAFVDHLSPSPDDADSGAPPFFELHVQCLGQRFVSKPVPCAVDPEFDESFLVDLQPRSGRGAAPLPLSALLRITEPLHLVLVRCREAAEGGFVRRELVASRDVEWRRVLGRGPGGLSLPVELFSAGAEAKLKVSLGMLQVRLDVLPPPTKAAALGHRAIEEQIEYGALRETDAHRQFYQYARAWWAEFAAISEEHGERPVKIFAETETGQHRAVCSFVAPLRPGRFLESPRHAARFVSLLPYRRQEAVGGGRLEIWHSAHSFLAAGKGDCEDHALLLCSLLLGFGLEAYVCVGTIADREGVERGHVWVMTRGGPAYRRDVTFWESTTGFRYTVTDPDEAQQHPYLRLGCVFSDAAFYANSQESEAVDGCSFELEDDAAWKAMDPAVLEFLPRRAAVALRAPVAQPHALEEQLEADLRAAVARLRRAELSLATAWDDDLGYLLAPALSAYETERVIGHSYGAAEFQAAIKRSVPVGHSFKGFPALFTHRDAERVLHTLQRRAEAREILEARGDHVHFGLRVKVVPYPEGLCAVWVMLAVRYRPPGRAV